jgi:hypothetical protein
MTNAANARTHCCESRNSEALRRVDLPRVIEKLLAAFLLAVINSKFDFALHGFLMPSRRKIRPEGKELSTTKKDAPDRAGWQKMQIRTSCVLVHISP